jgi:ribosomal protein S18 acetylase RimI-like enzyme
MKIEMKRLSDCPLKDAVNAYNAGFEGYFYEQSKTIESFSKRFGMEDLSPEHSVVAYYDGVPAGIVLSGMKKIDGEFVAWNGGTGVAKELRGKGVGKRLMHEAISIYRENDVRYATLEALSKNEAAIRLYEQLGYEVKKRLKFLQYNGIHDEKIFGTANAHYQIQAVTPIELSEVDFYRNKTPWQTHKDNIHDGNAIILRDEKDTIVGYSLYKKMYKEGEVASIGLLQLEAAENRPDVADIIKTLLKHSFSPWDRPFQRTTVNTPDDHNQLLTVLAECGFNEWEEQVWMIKDLAES